MGLSEIVQRRRGPVMVVAIMMIVMGLLLIVYQLFGNKASSAPVQGWFTTDDGATLFKDDISRAPPFDHNGKEAVAAYPYTADGGKHQWVQCLAKFDKSKAPPPTPLMPGAAPSVPTPTTLVKRPGTGDWVPFMDPRAQEITTPKAPPGMGSNRPEKVIP